MADDQAAESSATFVNVDVEVTSRDGLRRLAAHLRETAVVLHERDGFLSFESLAVRGSMAERMRFLLRLVEALPPAAKREWDSAERRTFDIGLQAAAGRSPAGFPIDEDILRRLVAVGGSVGLTLYSRPAEKAGSRWVVETEGLKPVELSRLRDIGWTHWDPIGIGPPRPDFADEYDAYLAEAFDLLRRGAANVVVAERLMQIEADHMGLGRRPDAERRAVAVVEAIRTYVAELARTPSGPE